MDRRTFLTSLAAALSVVAIPSSIANAAEFSDISQRIFGTLPTKNGVPSRGMASFLYVKNAKPAVTSNEDKFPEMCITVERVSYDTNQFSAETDLSNIVFEKYVEADHPANDTLSQALRITRVANEVARKSRIRRGNHYTQMGNDVIVWYVGNSEYDVPAQIINGTVVKNPKFDRYFSVVKNCTITSEISSHPILQTMTLVQ